MGNCCSKQKEPIKIIIVNVNIEGDKTRRLTDAEQKALDEIISNLTTDNHLQELIWLRNLR